MAYRVGMIGNGWRTQFFLNVIKQLPDLFELTGMYFRNPDKAAAFDATWQGVAVSDFAEFYRRDYDFVIVALPRTVVVETLEELFKRQIPVLCETPPCDGIVQMIDIWELKTKYDAKVQVVEQYCYQPYHMALQNMVQSGMLGEVSNINLSMIHDYHGISMMRKLLGVGMQSCQIEARAFNFDVTKTCGRDGVDLSGEVIQAPRKRATFTFADGKVGFFDFCGEQYFNALRTRHLNLQGTRGEVNDFDVAWLDDDNRVMQGAVQRDELGQWSNLEGYGLRGLQLHGKTLYQNPYPTARLNDDELAIATIMEGMGQYVHGGKEVYPLAEALQDTYLYLGMDEAIKGGGNTRTITQAWCVEK